MDNHTLAARALLDKAIYDSNKRFFIEHFGSDIKDYNLSEYHNLLNNLTNRLQLNLMSRGLIISDVPPVIRGLFVQGATLKNVKHFYSLPTSTLRKYRTACKLHKKSFISKTIPRPLLNDLVLMSRKVDTLQPQTLIDISIESKISIRRLMREVLGEI